MYDNIKSLRLVKEGSQTIVTGMISSEGEVMEFRHSGRYCSGPLHSIRETDPGQSSINALIANFKIELFYGNIVCWLPAGQFLLINLKPVAVGIGIEILIGMGTGDEDGHGHILGSHCHCCCFIVCCITLIDIGNWGLFMRLLSFLFVSLLPIISSCGE